MQIVPGRRRPAPADAILIVDLAKPEDPKIVVSLPLENSIVGPPVNLDIAPNGSIALVADSMTVAEDNGVRKLGPTDKLFVIDMKADPPKLAHAASVIPGMLLSAVPRPDARIQRIPGRPHRRLTTGVRAGAAGQPAIRAFREALRHAVREASQRETTDDPQ